MAKLLLLTCSLCVLVLTGVGGGSPAASPPSSTDCMNSLLGLTDCLTYVQNGSTVAKPDGGCCSGLKTVLKDSTVTCLCDAFKNSNSYGVSLNMTRAMNLPTACGISSNPLSQCAARSLAPANAPKASHHPSRPVLARAPTVSSPVSPVAPAMSPRTNAGGGNVLFESPAPAPLVSGSRESAKILSVLSLVFATLSVTVISCF